MANASATKGDFSTALVLFRDDRIRAIHSQHGHSPVVVAEGLGKAIAGRSELHLERSCLITLAAAAASNTTAALTAAAIAAAPIATAAIAAAFIATAAIVAASIVTAFQR
jgi:hypothetical protein